MANVASLSFKIDTKGLKQAQIELDALKRKAGGLDTQTNNTTKSFNLLSKSSIILAGSIYGIASAIAEVNREAMEMESIEMAMNAAVGGAKKARKELDFLKDTTDELGLVFKTSTQGFSQFAAAAKQTKLEGQGVRDIFVGVSKASTVMGLSVDNQDGVFRALTQMMSKGKIQAEELRGQLGERLPGAFQIAARSMDMTTSELDKFMASGKLISDDFLPKFAAQLEKEYGGKAAEAAKTARAEQARYNNALLDMKLAISDSGLDELQKDFYKLGTETIKEATHWLHEWNIQVNSMEDIKAEAGLGVLREQLVLAKEDLKGIQEDQNKWYLNQKDIAQELATKKWQILEIEKAISEETAKEDKLQEIADFNAKELIALDEKNKLKKEQLEIEEKQAKLQSELESRAIKQWGASVVEDHEKEMELITAKSELEIQMSQEKARAILESNELIKSDNDKLNEQMLETFEIMDGIWDSTDMEKFFDIWNEKLEDINKEQKKSEKYEGIGSKAWTAGLKGQSKDLANVGNAIQDIGKEQQSWTKYSEENLATEQDKNKHLQNQLGTYSNLAGAIGNMYEEGSDGAKAATAAQAALAVVEGGLAIVHAMTAGDPYTAVARALAVAAVVANAIGSFSSVGGTGGYSSIQYEDPSQRYDDSIEDTETMYEPTLNRLDRQIELLESIDNHTGESLDYSLGLASIEYQKATELAILEAGKLSGRTTSKMMIYEAPAEVERILAQFGDFSDSVSAIERLHSVYETTALSVVDVSANVEDMELSELLTFLNFLNDNDLLEELGYTGEEYLSIVDNIQQVTHDFTMSVMENMSVLTDYADNMKDVFDDLTQSDFYKTDTLKTALMEVENLLQGESLTDYIQTQITAITELENSLTSDEISLLLSTDQSDILAQRELVNRLQSDTNAVLDDGVIAALNYQDEIMLVADAMVEATEMFDDSLDSLQATSDSLQGTIDKLRASAVGDSYELERYRYSMSRSQALLASGDIAGFQDEVKKTQSLSGILSSSNVFKDDPFGYQQSFEQSIAASQFEAFQTNLDTEMDIMIQQRDLLIEQNLTLQTIVTELQTQNTTLNESYDVQAVSLTDQQLTKVA